MATNKAFKGGTFTNMRTPTNTPDKGNGKKMSNDNHSIASPKEKGSGFTKKMPSSGRPVGTWGGGHGRP